MNPQFKEALVSESQKETSIPRFLIIRSDTGWVVSTDGIADTALALEAVGILEQTKQQILKGFQQAAANAEVSNGQEAVA